MLQFRLPDMTCCHCVSTLTKTCKEVDPAARVQLDLSAKTVTVETSEPRGEFAEALAAAGYPPA